MPQWVIVLIVGVISFVVGLTANQDWTWPFTWIGIVLIIVATVLAVRGRSTRT